MASTARQNKDVGAEDTAGVHKLIEAMDITGCAADTDEHDMDIATTVKESKPSTLRLSYATTSTPKCWYPTLRSRYLLPASLRN